MFYGASLPGQCLASDSDFIGVKRGRGGKEENLGRGTPAWLSRSGAERGNEKNERRNGCLVAPSFLLPLDPNPLWEPPAFPSCRVSFLIARKPLDKRSEKY